MLFPTTAIVEQALTADLFNQKQVAVSVLRLDTLHPVVSGNKLFKLHYFLQNALQKSCEGIVTFGGAWSNHLVATAFACREAGLKSIGIVRGERPALLSNTLTSCLAYGMELKFISRQQYDEKESPGFLEAVLPGFNNYGLVPEGGFASTGMSGAAMIADFFREDITHICCAVGTGTTAAGLLSQLKKEQKLVCLPVLKNMHDLPQRIEFLTGQPFDPSRLLILDDYHFGGYAKKTPVLITFMNELYNQHQLPTDFVYTGKMMFGIIDAVKKDLFPEKSKILCIHTGGLQGNLSLPTGTLIF